jgi:bifunctional DNase/RNase
LTSAGKDHVIDSRPSDAIALALRVGASIFVDRKVIEKSRQIDLNKEGGPSGEKGEIRKSGRVSRKPKPEDFGKYKM